MGQGYRVPVPIQHAEASQKNGITVLGARQTDAQQRDHEFYILLHDFSQGTLDSLQEVLGRFSGEGKGIPAQSADAYSPMPTYPQVTSGPKAQPWEALLARREANVLTTELLREATPEWSELTLEETLERMVEQCTLRLEAESWPHQFAEKKPLPPHQPLVGHDNDTGIVLTGDPE